MAHRGDKEQECPQYPAYPIEESTDEENGRDDPGGPLVQPRREGVEDVATVELTCWNEIEGGDEESYPAGDQDGVAEGCFKRRSFGAEGEQGSVDNVKRKRFAEVDDGRGGLSGV